MWFLLRFIGGFTVGAICIAIGAVGMNHYHQSQPSLPYTEPAKEFVNEQGQDCVAWIFTNGAAVAICEGEPPLLLTPKKKQGYSS